MAVALLFVVLYTLVVSCFAGMFGLFVYQALVHHATTPIAVTILFSLVFVGLATFAALLWRLVYIGFRVFREVSDTPPDTR
jgi:hypothetical protein